MNILCDIFSHVEISEKDVFEENDTRLLIYIHCLYRCTFMYILDVEARLKGGPQVACMLQAWPGRSGKQLQEQISPNLELIIKRISVNEDG